MREVAFKANGDGEAVVPCLNEGGDKGSEVQAQAAQRKGGCPIPGNIKGQAGWGSQRLMELYVQCRGLELDDL